VATLLANAAGRRRFVVKAPGARLDERPGGGRQFAAALARGLKVLRAVELHDGLIGNQEIAIRTGLPSSIVSRLSGALTKHGPLTHPDRLGTCRLPACRHKERYRRRAERQPAAGARPADHDRRKTKWSDRRLSTVTEQVTAALA
jgi:hypothetical protein